jgi:hypothetical protein
MPKGKTKKRNRGQHQGPAEPQAPKMAPQAVAHRRGGTHQVRDQDRTDSIYNTYNYKDLLDTAKERGIYRKDMTKVEMAWALKHNDEEKKRAGNDALVAHQRKVQEQKKEEAKKEAERQKLIVAKHKRRIEKEKRRAGDEDVSDNTMSDAEMEAREVTRDEYKRENVGQALSDESWDSTFTESSTHSFDRPIEHDCKLRLFEWPYEDMPSAHEHVQQPGTFWVPEQLPWQVTYAPLKIVTTVSKQKLFLPGLKYPAGVDPDFDPILDVETRRAARNGHLIGVLRKAVVEKATHWAQRTLVQGWNGRIYFNLGSRNETKDLASTYQKWTLENRRLLRVKDKGDGMPADRETRHLQRFKNKASRTAEIYECCQYRPLAMCYIPAYSDFGFGEEGEAERTLENLFFIRFPGCDVPQYYFWVREGDWSNPTIRNSAWNPAEMNKPQHTLMNASNDRPRLAHKYPQKSWKPHVKMWMRVKKSDVQPQPFTPLSETSSTLDTIDKIEHALHSKGLAATLSHCRTKWLISGKQLAWEQFSRDLPALYPSGHLPDGTPVESSEGAKVAVKLAIIDSLDERDAESCLSPLRGDEGWTRDDDALWDVVEVDGPTSFSPNARMPEHHYGYEELVEIGAAGEEREEDDDDEFEDAISRDVEAGALYRRGSLAFNFPHGKEDVLEKWLEGTSPGDVPPSWAEELSGEGVEVEIGRECPFCEETWEGLGTEEQAAHMLSHNTTEPNARRCSPTSQYPLVALPPMARRPSCRLPRIRTNVPRLSIDLGTEGDIDTPRKPNFIQNPTGALRLKTKINTGTTLKKSAKRQRRRFPTDHPEAAYNPRKRSCSTIDSLEFLGIYRASRPSKRRQTAMPKVKILPREPGENNEDVSPVRLLMLERRKSKTDDPSYKPSDEKERPKKKRRIEDPTYRDTLPSSESDDDGMHHPISESQQKSSRPYQGILPSPVLSDRKLPTLNTRKRKSWRNETYKGGAVIFARSDDDATPSLPRPALNKRKKIVDPTYRDLSTVDLASSEESEVEVRPVRKVTRKMKKVR